MTSQLIFAKEPAKGWRPWGILVPLIGFALLIVSVGLLTVVLQRAHLVDAKENPVGLEGFAAFLLAPFAALSILTIAWVRLIERRTLSTVGLSADRGARRFSGGMLIGIAMMSAIVAADWASGGFAAGGVARAFGSPRALAGIAVLLVSFAVQSSTEELLFRGWMMSALAYKFGVVPAVLVSSLTFTLLHFEPASSRLFMPNLFLFGVFACCWSLRTGNIWGVMGWHAGWNWLLGVGFELPVTGLDTHMPALIARLTPAGPNYLTGGAQGVEASLGCSIVLIAGIACTMPGARHRLASTSA
ncbi:MAG TPA: type II CAAX endopeptidase family protein [Candidatus Angelobacter sp.]|nr:type II CAAX endopeptidase family protein [Candidatus Angelobacter sp.]